MCCLFPSFVNHLLVLLCWPCSIWKTPRSAAASVHKNACGADRLVRRALSGQVSIAAAESLRADAVAGAYKDLRALLRLLTHLTQRDLFDFDDEGAPGGAAVDVAEVGRPLPCSAG